MKILISDYYIRLAQMSKSFKQKDMIKSTRQKHDHQEQRNGD
jgi:hypothetical protein